MNVFRGLVASCLLLGVGGCQTLGQPEDPVQERPAEGEVPEELLQDILTAASEASGVPEDRIEIAKAEAVVWNDGSLGCPEPGMMYTQALVEGYHVVLRAGSETLDYRAGSSGDFKRCDSPSP